jgi:hypothetical protein
MELINHLTQLEINLKRSIQTLDTIDTTLGSTNIGILYQINNLMERNNSALYTYLERIRILKDKIFSKPTINESNQFIMSFDIDSDLYNKNFKTRFKKDLMHEINIHKLKTTVKLRSHIPTETKILTRVEGVDLMGNQLNLPVINDLRDIPPAIYWYGGGMGNKPGIYTSISPGFTVRIPLPNVIGANDPSYKLNSIPCKYETRELCTEYKKRISEIHQSEIRSCSYVHKREKFIKIGSYFRCGIESFGNYKTLNDDIKMITISDIKRILMNSLSDTLLSTLWYQNRFKNGDLILHNLDNY